MIRYRKGEVKDSKREVSGKGSRKTKRKASTPLNATSSTLHRIWTRTVVVFCVMVVVYYFTTAEKESKFAGVHERNVHRFQNLSCSPAYLDETRHFPKCVPSFCGRFVNDKVVDLKDVEVLLDFAVNGIANGGSSGGASILDLHSGALSQGKEFVDIYNMPQAKMLFTETFMSVFEKTILMIRKTIAEKFKIEPDELHLTHPTFFSRITNLTAQSIHDEYWHPHIDKDTYEAFHYTSLLYLSDYGKDFMGGRFIFVDKKVNMTIEPLRGRLSGFTSGAENLHFVEKVKSGTRYALTIAFTCDPKFAILYPKYPKANKVDEKTYKEEIQI